MVRLVITTLLILTLSCSAILGLHERTNKDSCNIPACCQLAHAQHGSSQSSSAEALCCILGCQEPGTTTKAQLPNLSPLVINILHAVTTQHLKPIQKQISASHYLARSTIPDQVPTYIRHSALLI